MPTPNEKTAELISHQNTEFRSLFLRLIDPDDLGYAVTPEVRKDIVRLLKTPETNRGELS